MSQAGVKSIHQKEHGALSYVAGYAVSKFFQINKCKRGADNEEFKLLLQNMKSVNTGLHLVLTSRIKVNLEFFR